MQAGDANTIVIDASEETIYTAIFRLGPSALAAPTEGVIATFDWWDYDGREGAKHLYERCLAALQSVGRAL